MKECCKGDCQNKEANGKCCKDKEPEKPLVIHYDFVDDDDGEPD